MTYTKCRDPWTAEDIIYVPDMLNFETIEAESFSYLNSHNHDTTYPSKAAMVAAYWYADNDGPGSGADADLLYYPGGNLHASDFVGAGIAAGLIAWWYGSVATIPDGWHLCDGTEGTIDLRGKMVAGAGTGGIYSVGASSGLATFTASGSAIAGNHTLTVAEMGPHTHPYSDAYCDATTSWQLSEPNITISAELYTETKGTTAQAGSGGAHAHTATFTGSPVASLPRYIALCFMQKLVVVDP
jgi:hypothetical protein